MVRGKRVVFTRPNRVEIEEYQVSEPNKDEVLIKTVSTLISSGTETAYLLALPNTPRKFPIYPGYSNSGIVIAKGENVEDVEVGDKVVAPANHASHVIVNKRYVYKMPTGLSHDEATFFNVIAIALQGVRKAQIEIGDSVVVLGLGLIGQLALALAKLNGALPLIGIDLYEYRLKVAEKLGADYIINASKEDIEKKVYGITNGGAEVVIEATGNPKAIPLAFKLARKFGRVILLGSTRGETTVNFYSDVHKKGLTIIGAHNSIRPRYESHHFWWTAEDDIKLALRLISLKRIDVKSLISLKLPYHKAAEAYDKLINAKNEVIAILLDWSSIG